MNRSVFKAVKFVFNLDRKKFFINYGLFTLEAVAFVIGIRALQLVLEMINAYSIGSVGEKTIIFVFVAFILLKISIYILRSFMGYYCEYYDIVLRKKVEKEMNKKNISPINYENKDFLDLLSQAYIGKNSIVLVTNAYIDMIFMYGLNLLFLAIYLYTLSKTLIFVLIVIVILQFLHNKFDRNIEKSLEESIKNTRRKKVYYSNLFFSKETSKEIHALDSSDFLLKKFFSVVEELSVQLRLFYKKLLLNDIRIGILKLSSFIMCFVIIFISKSEITLAQYGVLFVTMNSILSLVEEGFYTRIKSVNKFIPQLDAYFKFLEFDDNNLNENFSDKIVFENVFFKYPNTEKYALKNINVKIKKGQKIGVVGVNGSGKSTFSKLLLQLYKPTRGKITSIKSSSVFQDFMKYELSSLDNVKISDYEKEVDEKGFLDIGYIDKSKLDYDTILSKRFSDENLSQGQWQKLAILRGLHKSAEFLVFDEPTWAIDPLIEKEIFNFIYSQNSKGMLVITHRLSLIKGMDKIILLDKGELVGFDTHENLLLNNLYYQKLWEASSQ
ncbi:MAG: ATP-binding cassette domain-containing protein [Peptoniphilaceae bacterium]|uniref:ATP-binding cassette domain-containing protein n=1 Tax=Parvimonas sp. TaxID=1944660 RepID=UPI0025CD9715|nr:ATP-binding cassette domain-containing protein [Parvimonas sp.]MCI5997873.1 ATP-binding cassette domain-containing protein [Parvimonas sp.]MDD7765133.1 ATP-binding cassette domain-containing protein [Peptoniphilaceae bacterium]MDY3051503.1 ATP-binding cassette domain-containing protein [Parvimonas sp.]